MVKICYDLVRLNLIDFGIFVNLLDIFGCLIDVVVCGWLVYLGFCWFFSRCKVWNFVG